MNMPKSRDIQAKILLPQAIWYEFWLRYCELLEATGGIVQGLSGSPVIQNGKIIGAVTHVFVQDASSGYGIFIENMLKNTERLF